MIDAILVTRKINLIAEDVRRLEEFGRMAVDTYLANPIHEAAAERYLERIIGRMIDINYHLLTELGNPPPRDYFASFTELGTLGILPGEFAAAIAQTAGLRNRIVHEYDVLDERKVFEAIQWALRDIPRYIEHIHRYVQGQDR